MGSAPRNAPVVIDAFLNVAATVCTVVFDQPLTPVGALNLANWTVIWLGTGYPVLAALATTRRVVLSLGIPLGEHILDGVSYAPPPPDVRSRWNVFVAAFADYPLRIGP